MERGNGDNKGVKDYVRVFEAVYILDTFVKVDFGVIHGIQVAQSLGVDEVDVLLAVIHQPEDKIGIKVAQFEKADTPPPALVAQQVKLFPGKTIRMALHVFS